MIIIGAGYSGLLAGCIFKSALIYEPNSEQYCRDKHKAVLRMKSDKIAEYLGIRFKKVKVHKSIWYDDWSVRPTPDMIHMYSKKVSGTISNRSISDIDTCTRFIPPSDFFDILLDQSCQVAFQKSNIYNNTFDEPVINTKSLADMLKAKAIPNDLDLEAKPIYVNQFRIKNCDSYSTVYYPHPDWAAYRATLNGDMLIVESVSQPTKVDFADVYRSFSINQDDIAGHVVKDHKQVQGKVNSIPNDIRSGLLLDLTMKHKVYSLGRVATWRPKVMLDDVFDDIFKIRRLMQNGRYASVLSELDKEK